MHGVRLGRVRRDVDLDGRVLAVLLVPLRAEAHAEAVGPRRDVPPLPPAGLARVRVVVLGRHRREDLVLEARGGRRYGWCELEDHGLLGPRLEQPLRRRDGQRAVVDRPLVAELDLPGLWFVFILVVVVRALLLRLAQVLVRGLLLEPLLGVRDREFAVGRHGHDKGAGRRRVVHEDRFDLARLAVEHAPKVHVAEQPARVGPLGRVQLEARRRDDGRDVQRAGQGLPRLDVDAEALDARRARRDDELDFGRHGQLRVPGRRLARRRRLGVVVVVVRAPRRRRAARGEPREVAGRAAVRPEPALLGLHDQRLARVVRADGLQFKVRGDGSKVSQLDLDASRRVQGDVPEPAVEEARRSWCRHDLDVAAGDAVPLRRRGHGHDAALRRRGRQRDLHALLVVAERDDQAVPVDARLQGRRDRFVRVRQHEVHVAHALEARRERRRRRVDERERRLVGRTVGPGDAHAPRLVRIVPDRDGLHVHQAVEHILEMDDVRADGVLLVLVRHRGRRFLAALDLSGLR